MSMEPLLADRETDRDKETLPETVRLLIIAERKRLIEARNGLRDDLHGIDEALQDFRIRRQIVRDRLVIMDSEIEELSEHLLRFGISPD